MRYRPLGQTGLDVSEIGFGAWAIGGNAHGDSLGGADDALSLAALNRAYALGCTCFSTADRYGRGHSEHLIGHALKGWERDRVVIVTKGGLDFTPETLAQFGGPKPNFSQAHLRRAVDDSLARLGIEAIDVYLLDLPPLELIRHGAVFEVLADLKRAGKIRHDGVSIHDPQEGIQAIRLGNVGVVEAPYNLFDARIEKMLLPTCQETGTGLMVREPLARGFLSGKLTDTAAFEPGDVRAVWPRPLIQKRLQAARQYESLMPTEYDTLAQFALAYPLAQTAVSTAIPDLRISEEVLEYLSTGDQARLSAEVLAAVQAIQNVL